MGQATNALKGLLRVYWTDWLAAFAFFAIGGGTQGFIPPREVDFDVDDPDISYEYLGADTEVSSLVLLVMTIPAPVVLLVALHFVVPGRTVRETHHAVLGFMLAVGGALLFQGPFVPYVGRLRPDFLDRCQPDGQGVCTGDADIVEDGRRSFFSGHAALAMGSYMYVGMYLAGMLKAFDGRGRIWTLIVSFGPAFAALLIGASRHTDHRHHVSDIVVGLLDGFVWGIFAYSWFFHVTGPNMGTPRAVRDDLGLEAQSAVRPAV